MTGGQHRSRTGARGTPRGAVLLACAALWACADHDVRPEPVERPHGPLALQEAIELALRNNPDARLARLAVLRSAALVDEASSAFWPELTVSDAFTRTDVPSRAFSHLLDQGGFTPSIDFNDPGPTSNFHAGIGARATLYDGGRRRAQLTRGEASLGAAVAADEAARGVIALEAARAWTAVHETAAVAQTAARASEVLERLLELARAEREAGAALPVEVRRLEVLLAETRRQEETARQAEARARAGLGVLLGLGVEERLELQEPGPAASGEAGAEEAALPELPELLARARAGRAELVRAEREVEAAAAGLRAAEAGWLPRLGLSAEVGWDDADGALSRRHWLLGADVASLLTDAARTPSRSRRAAAELLAAHEAGRKVLLEVELEVQGAWLDLREARRRLDVAVAERAHAEQRLARAEAEHAAGAGRSSDLLEARLDEVRGRSAERVAHLRHELALLGVAHAVGELPAPPRPADEGAGGGG